MTKGGVIEVARSRWPRCMGGLVAAGAVLALGGCSDRDVDICEVPIVSTTSGAVCGRIVTGALPGDPTREVAEYLGIPYGASTAGDLRWTVSVPPEPWQGVQSATEYGPICPQPAEGGSQSAPTSEDCLSLNVWTPDPDGDHPVMVFIHGGSFLSGSGAAPVYDGANLTAARDAVVVTINYRLGALGFLAGINGLDGNYGILDQQLALHWVQDNIAGFGGDPDRVTLFGESAGAMSLGIQMTIPESAELFRAAIMESNPYGLPYKTLAQAAAVGTPFRADLSCASASDQLACMRAASTDAVLEAQSKTELVALRVLGLAGFLAYTPVIGSLIPNQPNIARLSKPIIAGTNLNEGTLFIAGLQASIGPITEQIYAATLALLFKSNAPAIRAIYDPTDGDYFAALSQIATDYLFVCSTRFVMLNATGPVYGYEYIHQPSFDFWTDVPECNVPGQVCHAVELPFVFGNPDAALAFDSQRSFTPAEQRLAVDMMRYWLEFAHSGNAPSFAGSLAWPPFGAADEVRQVLDLQISQEEGYASSNCVNLWDGIGYDLGEIFDEVFPLPQQVE